MAESALRCQRCHHHYRDHGAKGCRVHKIKWDDDTGLCIDVSACRCTWYLGEMPPPEKVDKCKHEFQTELNPDLCVHCNQTIKRPRASAKKK